MFKHKITHGFHQIKQPRIRFVIILSLLSILSYYLSDSLIGVFQTHTLLYNYPSNVFPKLSLYASQLFLIVIVLCLFKQFQNLKIQRLLMLILLFVVAIGLLYFTSITTYPYLLAISLLIANLSEPWRQLYVPSAMRATIEGIIYTITGALGVRVIMTQFNWAKDLQHYRPLGMALFVCALLFLWSSGLLKRKKSITLAQKPLQISKLLKNNASIFLICLLAGVYEGVLNYNTILSSHVMPKSSFVQSYLFAACIGSILLPLVLGPIADKKGIFSVSITLCYLLILINGIYAGLYATNITQPFLYYTIVFIETGLSLSLSSLTIALIGEHLRSKGIFRSFALSNLIFGIGIIINTRLLNFFIENLTRYRIGIAIAGTALVAIIYYCHRRETALFAMAA